jgi:hypothetical protein
MILVPLEAEAMTHSPGPAGGRSPASTGRYSTDRPADLGCSEATAGSLLAAQRSGRAARFQLQILTAHGPQFKGVLGDARTAGHCSMPSAQLPEPARLLVSSPITPRVAQQSGSADRQDANWRRDPIMHHWSRSGHRLAMPDLTIADLPQPGGTASCLITGKLLDHGQVA